MAGNLFVFPREIAFDVGVVQGGAKITFTATGTTTPQNTYTDIALTVASSNPVVADSEGLFAPIYLDPTLPDYRVKYTDSADVLIYQVDDVPASQSGQSLSLTAAAPFIDLIESDASANNGVWRIAVNSEQLTIKLGNDALSSFVDILTIDRTANVCDAIAITTTDFAVNGISTPIIKFKTADESVTSSTTLQDDDHLVGWNLVAGKYYKFEAHFSYLQNVGDIHLRFIVSNAEQTANYALTAVTNASVSFIKNVNTLAGVQVTTLTDNIAASIRITGFFQANASTGGTFKLQWAQNTSDSNATIVRKGSWISVRQLD